MKGIIALAFFIAGIAAITNPPFTGTTPPAVDCPNMLCNGKSDGNYAYRYQKRYQRLNIKENYFVQCVDGKAYCQACFPLSMKFKQQCNQCMYSLSDPCYTTVSWVPEVRFKCPDSCPRRGPNFSGNMADPSQGKHYIGCWKGVTMGCVNCPKGLLFNEKENACLYEGKFLTEPMKN